MMENFIKKIDYMKHAIGYNRKKITRSGYFKEFRNYFCSYKEDEIWEELVTEGYAIKKSNNNIIHYYVTKKGIEVLECLLDFYYKSND